MWTRISVIIFSSVCFSLGINLFFIPNEFLDGGMVGVSLILNYAFGFKAGLTLILLSLPVYILAWFIERPTFYSGLHGLLLSSFFIDLFRPFQQSIQMTGLMAALLGGLFVGVGIGLMLKFNTSTGGLDLLALFIARKWHMNVGVIVLFFDSLILLSGYLWMNIDVISSAAAILTVGLVTGFLNLRFSKFRVLIK